MKIQRLPLAIRIEVKSHSIPGGWSAVAEVFDHTNEHSAPLLLVPPSMHEARAIAEREAFLKLRDHINAMLPNRTVPDPVKAAFA